LAVTVSGTAHHILLINVDAGTGSNGYVDGAALLASLNYPWGITIDTQGQLYFTSMGYGIVRQITTTGYYHISRSHCGNHIVGVVLSLSGTSGFSLTVDGVGTSAVFEGIVAP
jgi:hypothetical protein